MGKSTLTFFFVPLFFFFFLNDKLLSDALRRILNESSRLQNAQHFLRGLRGWDMRGPFSQGKRQKTVQEREMHRLIREK